MTTLHRALTALVAPMIAVTAHGQVTPPAPLLPVPSERQLQWHEMEFYGFLHFTVNTFTDREWGEGDESPEEFNPSDLDVHQWVEVAKAAGMKGLILTAKHHDGFCLWPSRYTEHSVKHSPYKNGQGNVVGELAEACREGGLKFGVYLSPWDRNHAEYGRPGYIEYFRHQLRELLTEYGPIFEVWFDGANGGTGYYGGARENRKIDTATYYDWPNTWALVRELQPNAVMFSDVGPDIRWVGNERGFAGDPCWATYTPQPREPGGQVAPGLTRYQDGEHGHVDGEFWMPAEVDVSIRPGWFYHAKEDDKVRTPENLLKLYYESVGRGASLLLNLPPDRRGRIHERDVEALQGLRRLLDETFDDNLARDAVAVAYHVRGDAQQFAASNVLDDNRATYWTTNDDVTTATLEVTLPEVREINVVVLQEYIELGQRIRRFTIEAQDGDTWRNIGTGTSIGWKRILPVERVNTKAVRIRIDAAEACPVLSTVGLYEGPHPERTP